MKRTHEQLSILRALAEDNVDVVVNAFAGSGKTTTALAAADAVYNKTRRHTLIVTYSKRLKEDCRRRTSQLSYVHVESFHSLLYTHTYPVINDEHALVFLSDRTRQDTWTKAAYTVSELGLIVFDESQDLCPLLQRIVAFVCQKLSVYTRLLFIGDVFQCIFAELKQSEAFYFLAPQVVGRQFTTRRLSVSHRITPEIAHAVNTYLNPCLLKEHYPDLWAQKGERIHALWGAGISSSKPPSNVAVQYVKVYNMFNAATEPEITDFVHKVGTDRRPLQDLCILVDSTKPTTPGGRLVEAYTNRMNFLVVESGAGRGESPTDRDQKLAQNKSTICTIFAAKGLEWPLILHIGLSGYYEKANPLLCMSQAYTTWTRCSEELMVCMDTKTPFYAIRLPRIPATVPTPRHSTVLELFAYVPVDGAINACTSVVEHHTLPTDTRHMTDIIHCHRSDLPLSTYEDVSALIGMVVEATIVHHLKTQLMHCTFSCQEWEHLCRTTSATLRPHIKNQLTNFTFVDIICLNRYVNNALELMRLHLPPIQLVESHAVVTVYTVDGRCITGELDLLVNGSIVIELKNTTTKTKEHELQAACYYAMHTDATDCYLLNSKRGELCRVGLTTTKARFVDLCARRKLGSTITTER
jgi:hypothetical protein